MPIGNAKLLFDEVLGRQPVAVPTPATFYSFATHGPIAWYCIFNQARQQCTVVRYASDERRPVVEHIGIIFWTILDRLFKCPVVLPLLHKILLVLQCFAPIVCFKFHTFVSFQ